MLSEHWVHSLYGSLSVWQQPPVQQAVNECAAVTLGPWPAAGIAFMIGLLRNMLGPGTLLAFPADMAGAFAAGYKTQQDSMGSWGRSHWKRHYRRIIRSPICTYLNGECCRRNCFMPSFLVKSITGALIGWFIILRVKETILIQT